MKRTITILFTLCSIAACGQVITMSPAYKNISVTPPATDSILNTYPGAIAAYSFRLLRVGYTGKAVNVRRSSDNTTTDIGFLTSGFFDTTSFKTFIGAGTGYATIFYNQSTTGTDNLITDINANQPQIVIGTDVTHAPYLLFDGKYMYTANFGTWPSASLFGVVKNQADPQADAANTGHFMNFHASVDAGNRNSHYPFTDNNVYDVFGSTVRKNTGNPEFNKTNRHLYTAISLTNSWSNYYNNNIAFNTSSNVVGATTQLILGYQINGTTFPYIGNVYEIIIYNADESSVRTGIYNNINNFYLLN